VDYRRMRRRKSSTPAAQSSECSDMVFEPPRLIYFLARSVWRVGTKDYNRRTPIPTGGS
jgi:hypothetical protein